MKDLVQLIERCCRIEKGAYSPASDMHRFLFVPERLSAQEVKEIKKILRRKGAVVRQHGADKKLGYFNVRLIRKADPFPGSRRFNESATGGLRDNKGKPRLALVPRALLAGVAEVIWKSSTAGGGKYPMDNWRKGLNYRDTADCLLRHVYAWLEGEDYDKETGLHHLKHAACNLAFLLVYLETHPELDDRFKKPEGGSK